ncbi:MAG: transglycosylase domain-containing protein [Bacteroidota bacterium]
MQKETIPTQIKYHLQQQLEKWRIALQPLYEKWLQAKEQYPKGAWVALIGGSLSIFATIFVLFFYLSIRFEWFDTLPTEQELLTIENSTASQVYTEDGQILGKYYLQNRVNASLDEISPFLLDALVATEDVRYFDHDGVDIRAWVRVFFRSILMQDDSGGGGSTLSQQLAKNLFPRKRYRLLSLPVNKVREMIIAKRLERVYSKQELLTLYLNTVSFSDNTFGVKVASRRFFNTNPRDIKLEEAAVLVGMLKGTSYYNPLTHPERAVNRRNTVLAQMVKSGHLVKTNLDSLQAKPLKLRYATEGNTEGSGTYFREHLRLELRNLLKKYKKTDGTAYSIYTDGLKIYTTIDAQMQRYAEESVAEHMRKLQANFFDHWRRGPSKEVRREIDKIIQQTPLYQRLQKQGKPKAVIDSLFRKKHPMTIFTWDGEEEKEMSKRDSIEYYFMLLNTGFMAMNPKNGHVKAWVGGIDNKYFQYDHVKSSRQAGSTFKPIVYATALEKGIEPCEYIHNHLTIYTEYDNWKPENSDGQYEGVYSMEGALSNSVNVATVDLIMRSGIDSVKYLAEKMGITSNIPAVPSIALGTPDVSLYDIMKVYGTFANQGRRVQPTYIRRIETKTGEVLVDFDDKSPESEQVIQPETAAMITRMLQSVVDSGTARRLRYQYHLRNHIAGKTGTTQNHSDGWFMGYTPHLVAGVWVGAESPKVHFRTIHLGQGANMALPIWGRFMNKVYKDPRFRQQRKAQFKPLPDSLYWAMDCAPYLEEMPVEDIWEDMEENASSIFDVIFGQPKAEEATSTRTNRSDRPKKKSNRKKKKKKRNLFERIFGKKQ